MSLAIKAVPLIFLVALFFAAVAGQEKKNQKPIKDSVPVQPASDGNGQLPNTKKAEKAQTDMETDAGVISAKFDPTLVYTYLFERPDFTYPHVVIEHKDNGIGRISFTKTGWGESIDDPIALSQLTMQRIRAAFAALDFLNSDEIYQTDRDHSNMGNVSITLRNDKRDRTAKYNWSENKDAKFLMDEYRRISNEFLWLFEFSLAIENQPLQTPGLMELMDSYLRRKEISDPKRLLPILIKYTTDERLPLMARNRAAKLINGIEKAK